MENKVKFSENVFLIDAIYLKEVAGAIQQFMGMKVGRALPNMDLAAWLTYLALDAGIGEGENEIQIILVHDEETRNLTGCEPSDLRTLQGMACRTSVGEFSFACVPTAELVSCGDLFLDLTTLALDSADVKRLVLLPAQSSYGQKLCDVLNKFCKEKEDERDKAVLFALENADMPVAFRWDSPAYSMARAFGLRSDEF